MKKFVRENLYENFKEDNDDEVVLPEEIENDDDVDVKDDWETPEENETIEDEVDSIDASDMESEEIELDETPAVDIKTALDLELEMKEFNRETNEFRVIPREKDKRGRMGEIVTGVVMAKLSNDNYIFKTDKGMRKFNIKDMVLLENETLDKELNEMQRGGMEYEYVDYLFDIAGFLMLNPENVQAILNIHNVNDEEEAKIDITNELEDNEEIYGVKAMYDAGVEPEIAAEKIVNNFQG